MQSEDTLKLDNFQIVYNFTKSFSGCLRISYLCNIVFSVKSENRVVLP